jgi:hypothetical protein
LQTLAKQHSQSEIARRTGTPVANVHRYLKSGKIPAEFCGALVAGLGVNPAWLLHGEGAPSLADVGERPARMAGEMLELVEAMNAVAEMRLGSLAGKHHLNVLRELNDALLRFEKLRDRLQNTAGPVFSSLQQQYAAALNRRDMQRADELRLATSQVARLCPTRKVERELAGTIAHHEYVLGNAAESIRYQRDVFHQWLPDSELVDDTACHQAHNLVVALRSDSRLDEAIRLCRGVLELTPPRSESWVGKAALQTALAALEMDTGDIASAMARLQIALPHTQRIWRRMATATQMRGLWLGGSLTWRSALGFGDDSATLRLELLRYACWLEDAGALSESLAKLEGDFATERFAGRMLVTTARALRDVLSRGKKALLNFRKHDLPELRGGSKDPLDRHKLTVLYAQLCAAGKDRKSGAAAWKAAEEALAEVQPGRRPAFEWVAQHQRNALRVLPSSNPKLAAARSWLQEQIDQGYGSCATALQA